MAKIIKLDSFRYNSPIEEYGEPYYTKHIYYINTDYIQTITPFEAGTLKGKGLEKCKTIVTVKTNDISHYTEYSVEELMQLIND